MFEAPRQFRSATFANAELPAAAPAGVDLWQIGATLWRGRMTILWSIAACLLLALVFEMLAPHRYTAMTEILIEPVDLRAVANDPTPSAQASDMALLQVDSQVRVLTSDDVLRRVVDSEGLAHDPEFVRGPSLLRALADRVLGRDKPLTAADRSLAALDSFRRHVKVKRDERTYVVDVAVSSADPAKAARLANAVAQSYLDEQTAVRADAARQISQSLTARLNELKTRVHQAEERAEQFKASHNIVDANGQLVNGQQLTELDKQLAAAGARMAAAKARLDQIEAVQSSKTDIGAFPDAVLSPTVAALRGQYAEIMRQEAEQTINLGDRHPAVIEIQAQAERLKRMIADEVNRIALAARADYESAKTSEDLLKHQVDVLKQNALATDAAMVSLRELQRDVQASRAVYEAFLVRARETGEQERVDTKNIQVISKADLPLNRSFPPSTMLLMLAAPFVGFAAGSGLVLMRASLADGAAPRRPSPGGKFRPGRTSSSADEAPLPRIPVLARLPGVDTVSGFDVMDDPNSRFAAGIGKVYDAVQANHHKRGSPTILIVASDGDNDAAAVALTLAALAAATQRVLLIDADLERRTLMAIDADRSEAGLVDVAVGRRRLSEVVIRDRDTNINLVPFVSPHSRRDRTIHDEDVKAAFAQTRKFGLVIVAAMDLRRDPSTRFFAGLVDHIVLVSRAGDARGTAVDEVVSGLGLDARKVRGTVLTEADAA